MREQYSVSRGWLAMVIVVAGLLIMGACQPPAGGNVTSNKTNTNLSIPAGNSNANSSTTSTSAIETKEPGEYQAKVDLKFEAVGEQQSTQLPAIGALVARNGADRRMEFSLPNGEKVVYLDKGDTHYLILPNRKQYAELNKEALGFEVRGMLMPENIVNQVKSMKGVELVGEETSEWKAGAQIPVWRVSRYENEGRDGGNPIVSLSSIKKRAYRCAPRPCRNRRAGRMCRVTKALKFVTEMSDVKTAAPAELFEVPKGFAKDRPRAGKITGEDDLRRGNAYHRTGNETGAAECTGDAAWKLKWENL